jgi:1,4-alpha-glucan branching enzyme
MPQLADALKLTQTSTDQWYEATNYPESHDEVGNVNDRIVNVAGYGQGLRRNKVAAAITLFSRGIPMWFMGAEAGEHRQFCQGDRYAFPLESYLQDQTCSKIRAWWNRLCDIRRGNNSLQGPAPLEVHFANPDEQLLAFSRGNSKDFFVILNFGCWSGWRRLGDLNLPEGTFKEMLNSTWPAFAVENEDEHTNGSSSARLDGNQWLNIPEYGAVILQRV